MTEVKRALVVGVTGIVGQAVAGLLVDEGWTTYGLSRSGGRPHGATPVVADLSDLEGLSAALAEVRPELVAITAWTRCDTEAENIEVNGGAVRNVSAAVEPGGSVTHVALMTGLKHYLGPFEAYAVGKMPDTPFHEYEPRGSRPRTSTTPRRTRSSAPRSAPASPGVSTARTPCSGSRQGNAMNMVATICAYASICQETGKPFVFPGSETQWNGVTYVTDAELLAEQILWCAGDERGQNEPFNIANGDVFRWRWLWPQVAEYFGVPWEGFEGEPRTLETAMAGAERVWGDMVSRHGLVEPESHGSRRGGTPTAIWGATSRCSPT